MTLPAPELEHVCDLAVEAGVPELIGDLPVGTRRVIPIAGGSVTGPLINGEIVPVGADWQTVTNRTDAELDARYLIRAADGALIEIADTGFRHGPHDVMTRLAAGEDVAHDQYYMRSSVRLRSGDERYGWVNTTVFVGTGRRSVAGVSISIYAVR